MSIEKPTDSKDKEPIKEFEVSGRKDIDDVHTALSGMAMASGFFDSETHEYEYIITSKEPDNFSGTLKIYERPKK